MPRRKSSRNELGGGGPIGLRCRTMKRKKGSGELERNFWIVVILFVVVAVILILIEAHYWKFE
jgi:hypothetical protein